MTNIFEDDSQAIHTPEPETPTPEAPPRKFNMNDDKDRNELIQLLKLKALVEHPDAIAKVVEPKAHVSNIVRDDKGNVAGTKNSVMSGIHATAKNQADLFKALKADAQKRYGIKE
jgi:hypothetical protein